MLYYLSASTSGQAGYVVGYDQVRGAIRIQLTRTPILEFYSNGAVKVMLSHNHSMGALWPYVPHTYLPETDSYQEGDIVTSWDKIRGTGEHDEPFPEEVDRSGTGTVYYVDGWYEGEPMDRADYLAWEREFLEDSDRLLLEFLPLTEENIAAVESGNT